MGPEDVTIRDEAASDHDAVRRIHLAAFSDDGAARIADDLRRSGEVVISLIAERGRKPAGHVLFSRLQAPMRALVLSPLGVRPEFQRKGIGSALVRKGLERAEQDGWEAVFLVGSPVYYKRFGFSAEAARGYNSPYYGPPFQARILAKSVPRVGELKFPDAFAEDIRDFPAVVKALFG